MRASEDRPILLSIGYAACHWCHVMERESFEDDETARVMNENFVSVKVDREERPDLDAIYMDAVVALTGQRRLADDGVPDARTASRSSAAPTSRRSRATACRRSSRCCSASPRRGATSATRSSSSAGTD